MKTHFFELFIYLFFMSLSISVFGQTGPAGVGNAAGANGEPENIIWLDASTLGLADGAAVTTWADLSGNGNDLAQQGTDPTPLFETNGLFSGSHNAVRFDGTERYLILGDNADLDSSMGGITIIAVIYNATLDGLPRAIYSKRAAFESQSSYNSFTYTSSKLNFTIDNGSTRRLVSSVGLNTSTDYISTNRYSGSLQEIYLQSTQSGSASTSGNITNSTSNLLLGALNDDYGDYFDGDIAELIFYREALNDGERLVVENYLSQKYGITITNDFFGTDAGFDAAFTNDFMGIGTGDGSAKLSDSGPSDALQITETNGSLNSSNEFIMLAHDNTAHADRVTANITVDPGVLSSRWARSWFLQTTGDVSAKLKFDFGTAGLIFSGDPSHYVLLYRANTTDDYTEILANSYTVENGDQLVVDLGNTTLPSGYYTVGERTQLVMNWYSFQSGDWSDPSIWTTISNGSLREPAMGGVPRFGDNVTILYGRTVRMDTDDNDGTTLTVNGRLDIEATSGHDYFSIAGNGVISIEGDASSNDNFPTGDVSLFADPVVGGTVEILGSGLNLNTSRTYNNMLISLDNVTDVATLLVDYTLNGALTISDGILQINNNSNTTSLSLTVNDNVQINASGELNVGTANARHEFNFYGDFLNQGRAEFTNKTGATYYSEATNGIVDANFLNESSNQTIDCNGVTNFYRIEIDKGIDQTYILDINSLSAANFNLFGSANHRSSSNAMGLVAGTVRLNTNVNIPVLNTYENNPIYEEARLWINGGIVATLGNALTIYGTLQISDGTLDVPLINGLTFFNQGNIIVEGGVLTTNTIKTSTDGNDNIGGYTQSGGTVNLLGGFINQDYYTLSLTYSGNTFNMSGGTLRVAGSSTFKNNTGSTSGRIHGGGIFINSDPSNISVTGGKVIMDNNTDVNFKVTSKAPFWDVIMRSTGGTATEIDMDTGTSGNNASGSFETITTLDLRVLNDLTVENGVIFDHNGFDVEIGSDFTVQPIAAYVFDDAKQNTLTLNGVDNSTMSLLNVAGGSSTQQVFYNLTIDKPHDKTVRLASSKTGANLESSENNLFRVDGEAFKVLSGTLDQGQHSILANCDSVVNYDVLTVYNAALGVSGANAVDAEFNGNNDQFKLDSSQGTPTDMVFITADTAVIGNLKYFMQTFAVTTTSDLTIQFLEHSNGRLDIGDNNLKVQFYNEASGQGFQNGPGMMDMIVTNGNASDGGVSLYVSGNQSITYPFGVGLTGVSPTSKYTPADVTITNFSDDGYITIVPVNKALATLNNSPTNVLQYYWKLSHTDFSVLPDVQLSLSYNDIDVNGIESLYVPGRVIDVTNREEDTGVIADVDDVANTIDFSVLTLKESNYSAGVSLAFTETVRILWSRKQGEWHDPDTWSTAEDGSSPLTMASQLPGVNDIVVIGTTSANYHVAICDGIGDNCSGTNYAPITVAQVSILTKGSGENSILSIDETAGVHDLGIVTNLNPENPKNGGGSSKFSIAGPTLPAGDFGEFNSAKNAIFSYARVFPVNITDARRIRKSGGSIVNQVIVPSYTIGNTITEYPNLQFESTAAAGGSVTLPDTDITVNHRVNFFDTNNNQNYIILNNGVGGDVTVRDDFRLNDSNVIVEFPATGNSRTLTVKGDIDYNNDANNTIQVEDGGDGSLVHNIQVQGDILNPSASSNLLLFRNQAKTAVNLEFNGTGNSIMTSFATMPELNRLIANKANGQSETIMLSSDFNLGAVTNTTTKALELQSGTLIIDNTGIDIDLTTGGGDFMIPEVATLQVTSGEVNVSGSDTGISLDGALIIDGGTVDMDNAAGNGNNYIEYSVSGNAIINISSGILNVGSQIRPITSANTGILKYRQTGGDVRIGTRGGPESTRGMLQIYNVGSEFTYTGGTLTIERHQTTPSIAALYLNPEVSDITGSTITIFNANTPAGQADFRINSMIALNNLTINGTNSPTVNLNVNPLIINNQLSIASNATLNGNALTLTIGGDLVNDGTYDVQDNETIFNTTTNQSISGVGTNTFFKFTKENIGTLALTNTINVADLFTITEGTVDDNGFSINLAADAVIDGTHISVGGSGLVFAGASNQELRRSTSGTGTVGVISINNSNGLTVPDGSGYKFNIDGGLRLEDGVFNVGGASILFGTNADITPVNPFSITNMIQTNSSFVDSGIGKQFAANYSTDFTFPVGQAFYTPVSFDFGTGGNTFGITAGTLIVRPANEFHPTVNDGTVNAALGGTGDINNVLQYYWTVEANGVIGMNVDMTLSYDQSDVLVEAPAFDETDYIAARIFSVGNPTFLINKFTNAEVDETTDIITFNFSNAGDNSISGDYFAGIDEAITDNVAIYTVNVDGGNVGDDVYAEEVPGGGVPTGSVVVVPYGYVLSLDQDDIRFYATKIQLGGVLEIDNTTNHRLGELTGTGRLRVISNGLNSNMPAFSGSFLSCSGGGLEYSGTGSYSILSGISTVKNLTLSGSGTKSMANNNLVVCNNLIIDGPTFVGNVGNFIRVDNNMIINSGEYRHPSGFEAVLTVSNSLLINGGLFRGGFSSGSVIVNNDLIIEEGDFILGGASHKHFLAGNLIYISGTFDGGSASSNFIFNGTSPQSINGNFTGTNEFHNFQIDNSAGVSIATGGIEIANTLTLTDGVIETNGNQMELLSSAVVSPATGSSNSYIAGRLDKVISTSGTNFTFPIGCTDLWRPATVNNVSDGGLTWSAEYFKDIPTTDPLVDNTTPTSPNTGSGQIATVSEVEYWKISDDAGAVPPSGVTANVGLSWGMESNVSPDPSERVELEVMMWNDGISSWDNMGGTLFSSGHTQSGGCFIASSTNTFNEQIFTLGSGDASNPLPITLESFSGYAENGKHYLAWVTSSEINNDYFELQRSLDGLNYEVIAEIDGVGTTTNRQSYSYIDRYPVFGKNYYRLVQVDIDGQRHDEGDIILLENDNPLEKLDYKLYPNPTSRSNINLNISSPDSDREIHVSLFDVYGRRYYYQKITANELNRGFSIDTHYEMNNGMYLMVVEQGDQKVHKRLIIE